MNESLFRKTKNTITSDVKLPKRSEVDEMLVSNESQESDLNIREREDSFSSINTTSQSAGSIHDKIDPLDSQGPPDSFQR